MGRIFGAAGFALAALFSFANTVAAEPLFAQMTAAQPLQMPASAPIVTAPAVIHQSVIADAPPAPTPAPLPITPPAAPPAPKRSLAELVAAHGASEAPSRDLECLAGAVYFEAKSEALAGQLAVAEVVRNRASSGRFPSSYCGVVFQRSQFSFVRGGALPAIPRASAQWRRAVAVARIAHEKLADTVAPRALFFHAARVSPGWKLTRLATIGGHVFYR